MATINIKQDSKGQSIQIGGNLFIDTSNPQQYDKFYRKVRDGYYRYPPKDSELKTINICSGEGCEHESSLYLTMDDRETVSKETIEEVKEGLFCLIHIEEATLWLLETVQKEVE